MAVSGEAERPLQSGSGWVGPAIPAFRIAAVMGIALQASLVAALQPMLFSALVAAHRLTDAQVGLAATLELSATGIVATATIARLPPRHIRPIVAVAALVAAFANIATANASPAAIMAARTVSGCCSGIFMWQLVCMLTRASLPARLNGIYLASQGAVGLLMAAVFANLILPRLGAPGGFLAMGCLGLAAVLASWLLPVSYVALPSKHVDSDRPRPTSAGWLCLASTFMLMSAVLGAWIYLPQLARQGGYPASVIATGTPLALGAEILGGALAAFSAARLSWRIVVPGVPIGFAMLLVAFMAGVPPWLLVAGLGGFGFLWMFVVPFQFSYALAIDPSRATLLFVSPAQLLGCGFGPVLAAFGAGDHDVRGAEWIAVTTFVVSILLFFLSASPVFRSRPEEVKLANIMPR